MRIDLHIHSFWSDGAFSIEEIFQEARNREIELVSITDHDSIECQPQAVATAKKYGVSYITGIEMNVTFPYRGKPISLDFLGYKYDAGNIALRDKLKVLRKHREERARQILEKLNAEFDKEGIEKFNDDDLKAIQDSVDGTFGRPHIANYLVAKGIVKDRQEAFDKYLVKCDVAKYPLSLAEASNLIRSAGGIIVHAHPGDPNGTSLSSITSDLHEQTRIITEYMLEYIDGIECWHYRHDEQTAAYYTEFAKRHKLVMTGGSDCHQKPILIGTVDVPGWVADQFR